VSVQLFVVVFYFLNYFRNLIVDVSLLTHLSTYLFGRIHDSRVVSIAKVRSYFWERHVCELSTNVHGDLSG